MKLLMRVTPSSPLFGDKCPAAAAAAAFDEVRDREALREHRVQVLAENGRVQRLAFETAAQEKRATAPQDGPD